MVSEQHSEFIFSVFCFFIRGCQHQRGGNPHAPCVAALMAHPSAEALQRLLHLASPPQPVREQVASHTCE